MRFRELYESRINSIYRWDLQEDVGDEGGRGWITSPPSSPSPCLWLPQSTKKDKKSIVSHVCQHWRPQHAAKSGLIHFHQGPQSLKSRLYVYTLVNRRVNYGFTLYTGGVSTSLYKLLVDIIVWWNHTLIV